MKSRWLLNLVLLVLVAAIAAFLYLRPKPAAEGSAAKIHTLSKLEPNSVTKLSIEAPGKNPVLLEKQQGRWHLVQPARGRASLTAVGRVLSIAVASTQEKFPADDLARFGLDNPAIKVRIDGHEFSFGMYHPVSGDQFVAYDNAVYVVPPIFSESAAMQPLEFLDKRPLDLNEDIAGFDFAGLEQWEKTRLALQREVGNWQVTPAKGKPNQQELGTWFADNWPQLEAKSVEPYTPTGETFPWFSVKLKNGKSVRFLKLQESPELLLVREDEQLLYHFPQDTGFVILNPPVGYRE